MVKLLDVMTAPWAIEPDKLVEIRGVYETHLKGGKIDLKGIEARIGRPLANEPQGYDVVNGAAVIPVHGVIGRRMNLFTSISGGASTELVARDLRSALADPAVARIVLNIDSPGGTVDGTAELAQAIHGARGVKPIVALANGAMASAAYWIGSAADAVYVSGPTAQVGSIGVIATHVDQSRAEEAQGIKVTEITAGRYKGNASPHEPLSREARDGIQARVDYLYGVFVEAVARHRAVDVATVLNDMADGRLFIGRQAVDAGLVDGVSTLEALTLGTEAGGGASPGIKMERIMSGQTETVEITAEYLKERHCAVFDAILAEGHKVGVEDGRAAGVEDGARAERERIEGILEMRMDGFDDLVTAAIADGKTTGPEVAAGILKAQKARGVSLHDLAAEAQAAGAAHLGADDDDAAERTSLVQAMAAGTGRKKEG